MLCEMTQTPEVFLLMQKILLCKQYLEWWQRSRCILDFANVILNGAIDHLQKVNTENSTAGKELTKGLVHSTEWLRKGFQSMKQKVVGIKDIFDLNFELRINSHFWLLIYAWAGSEWDISYLCQKANIKNSTLWILTDW